MKKYVMETSDNTNARVDDILNAFSRKISAYPPGICPLTVQMSLLQVSRSQTCGKCVPCRDGLVQLEKLMQSIVDGKATMTTLSSMKILAEMIRDTSDCAIGYNTAAAVLEGMEVFEDEYLNHIQNHLCNEDIEQKVPCIALCPAHVDIPGYIALVRAGDYAGTTKLIRQTNPFPTTCGMICEHPCEARCRRSLIDSPLNIRGLKKFAVDYKEEYLFEWMG